MGTTSKGRGGMREGKEKGRKEREGF